MIIKGKSRSGPSSLAAHLGNAEKNERVQLLSTRGTAAQDLRGALIEMDAVAAGTRCEKPLYHAAISPEPPHRLGDDQRMEAVDALEKKLGLEGHARVVVLHEKLGREHLHVVWSRIDIDTMRSVSDSHNYRKHEECSRDLERRFGHERVQGAHAEREGPDGRVLRPDRTPTRAELRQEERTGITGKQVREEVSGLFRASDGPEAFKAALEERGYQLAKGDRRDLVIIDQAGGVHSLARRIDTMKAADLRAFMAPLDRSNLPSADEARTAVAALNRTERNAEAEAALEKRFSKGGDYVSQSRAALAEHKRLQKELDDRNGRDSAWDRIEAGEKQRAQLLERRSGGDDEHRTPAKRDDPPMRDVELTDAMQARLDRLREAKVGLSRSPGGTSRQSATPGDGHSRGR
jgi:hypothetical protein